MRNYFIAIILFSGFSLSTFGQNEAEALKFSQNFSGGTARSLSMSGAFGALGGDASTLSTNPAGIAVFRKSDFSITLGVNNTTVTSDYLNTSYDDIKTKFNLSNLSYIQTINTNKNTGLVSINFGFAYNRLNDFNSTATIIGKNAQSSLLDEFVNYANGEIDSNLPFDQQRDILDKSTPNDGPMYYYEGLAYRANQLIFLNEENNQFMSDYMFDGYNQYQKKRIITTGGIGEYDFSMGANIGNLVYLGATIGVQNLAYERIDDHYEEPGISEGLNSFRFKEHFNSFGNGVNVKIGAIVKPIDFLRMGLAYNSPTYFNLESEFYTSVDVDFGQTSGLTDANERTDLAVSDYKLKTPSKVLGSMAFIFDKFGLISVDVERLNYSKARFRSDDYEFIDENSAVKESYKSGVYNIKVGAEGKLGPLALRVGYANYGKPYKEDQFNYNTFTSSYSGGIGIRGKSVYFDVAYVYSTTNENHNLYTYTMNDKPAYQLAKLKTANSKIMATLGFRF